MPSSRKIVPEFVFSNAKKRKKTMEMNENRGQLIPPENESTVDSFLEKVGRVFGIDLVIRDEIEYLSALKDSSSEGYLSYSWCSTNKSID